MGLDVEHEVSITEALTNQQGVEADYVVIDDSYGEDLTRIDASIFGHECFCLALAAQLTSLPFVSPEYSFGYFWAVLPLLQLSQDCSEPS